MARSTRILAVALCCLAASAARADEIGVRIPTRPGVATMVLYEAPAEPRAVAVLLPGGEGVIGIHGEGPGAGLDRPNNFLIRSRHRFAGAGIAAVSVDVPSDQAGGIDESFRLGRQHAEDIAAVVAWAHGQTSAPVWLIGTSMGSISAVAGALHLGGGIGGVVLTSSVDQPSRVSPQGGLAALPVETLTVPVLVMDHAEERCRSVGPPERLAARTTGAPRHALAIVEGGSGNGGANPCGPLSAHGYLGVEDQAVAAIAAFMLAP